MDLFVVVLLLHQSSSESGFDLLQCYLSDFGYNHWGDKNDVIICIYSNKLFSHLYFHASCNIYVIVGFGGETIQ